LITFRFSNVGDCPTVIVNRDSSELKIDFFMLMVNIPRGLPKGGFNGLPAEKG